MKHYRIYFNGDQCIMGTTGKLSDIVIAFEFRHPNATITKIEEIPEEEAFLLNG